MAWINSVSPAARTVPTYIDTMIKNQRTPQSRRRGVANAPKRMLFAQISLRAYALWLLLLVTLAAAIFGPIYYTRRANAQDVRAGFEQDLQRVFARHEDVTLDSRAIAARVRQRGRLSLKTASRSLEIQLSPNDLRAPNYRAEEVGSDGLSHRVAMGPVSTYKGNVDGVWGSDARFTITDDKVEGLILTSSNSIYVEPASKYSASRVRASKFRSLEFL